MPSQLYVDPEWTGDPGLPIDPNWLAAFGSVWQLTDQQLQIASRIMLRAMILGDPPNAPDNVYTQVPNTINYAPPQVVQTASKLMAALLADPYKSYVRVPIGARINWRNYACLGAYFHGLSPQGQDALVADIRAGRRNIWIPVIRQYAMSACPYVVYSDPAYQSAAAAERYDAYPPGGEHDPSRDTTHESLPSLVLSQAREQAGTSYGFSTPAADGLQVPDLQTGAPPPTPDTSKDTGTEAKDSKRTNAWIATGIFVAGLGALATVIYLAVRDTRQVA